MKENTILYTDFKNAFLVEKSLFISNADMNKIDDAIAAVREKPERTYVVIGAAEKNQINGINYLEKNSVITHLSNKKENNFGITSTIIPSSNNREKKKYLMSLYYIPQILNFTINKPTKDRLDNKNATKLMIMKLAGMPTARNMRFDKLSELALSVIVNESRKEKGRRYIINRRMYYQVKKSKMSLGIKEVNFVDGIDLSLKRIKMDLGKPGVISISTPTANVKKSTKKARYGSGGMGKGIK